jgi:biotin transporter BioY
MSLLHVFSRPHILARLNFKSVHTQSIVVGVNIVLGAGLMLLATMSRYDAHAKFATTPWIIPTIFLVFLTALVLIHFTRSYGKTHGNSPNGVETPNRVQGTEKDD